MAEKSEKDLLLYHLDQKIKKAIESYRLIENGDRILIGLSGGPNLIPFVVPGRVELPTSTLSV